jgi:hypothetical protein
VVGRGFADLLTRGQVQQAELQATTQRLQDLRDLTHKLERRQVGVAGGRRVQSRCG